MLLKRHLAEILHLEISDAVKSTYNKSRSLSTTVVESEELLFLFLSVCIASNSGAFKSFRGRGRRRRLYFCTNESKENRKAFREENLTKILHSKKVIAKS